MRTLTKRQADVLLFIVAFLDTKGYAPSYEEIAKGVGLRGLSTVSKHLDALERKQYIRRGRNQSRAIEVIAIPKKTATGLREAEEVQALPILGYIGDGRLWAAEEREWLTFSEKEGVLVVKEGIEVRQ